MRFSSIQADDLLNCQNKLRLRANDTRRRLGTTQPLANYAETIELAAASYLGQGNIACYRGPELYDSPPIQGLWAKWVAHYKKYRPILMADPVHVKRPTGANEAQRNLTSSSHVF
jgi:hypothetical protein